MSDFTKIFGLPSIHLFGGSGQVVKDAENILLTGVEKDSALGAKIVAVIKEIIANPPTTPISAVSDGAKILVIFDPNVIEQIESNEATFLTSLSTKLGLPSDIVAAAIKDLATEETAFLESIGFPAPPPAASTAVSHAETSAPSTQVNPKVSAA